MDQLVTELCDAYRKTLIQFISTRKREIADRNSEIYAKYMEDILAQRTEKLQDLTNELLSTLRSYIIRFWRVVKWLGVPSVDTRYRLQCYAHVRNLLFNRFIFENIILEIG